jgi:hypothetical protein
LQAKRRETVLIAHHDHLIEIAERSLETTRVRSLSDSKAKGILPAQSGKVRAAQRAKEIAIAQLPKVTGGHLELFEHFVGLVSVHSR